MIGSFDQKLSLASLDAAPNNSISYYKGVADRHVSSYQMWSSKGDLASSYDQGFASKLFGAAEGEAKLGLDSNRNLAGDIWLLENDAFRILQATSQTSKLSKASDAIVYRDLADKLDQKNPGMGTQYRKQSESAMEWLDNVAAMEEMAQKKVSYLHEVSSSMMSLLADNELLFGKLKESAEQNIALSGMYLDDRSHSPSDMQDTNDYSPEALEKAANKHADKKDKAKKKGKNKDKDKSKAHKNAEKSGAKGAANKHSNVHSMASQTRSSGAGSNLRTVSMKA